MKGEDTATLAPDDVGPAPARPRGPVLIDRFRVLDTLGAGGMGVVYEAHDPQLDRHVALKVVRSTANPEAQSNLVREAQAMAKLQHPNVVAVYDVGVFENQVFVAMELVDGVTLGDWLAAQPRSWREIARAFLGASRGLAAAHDAGLVHRDFKPSNVLIADDGTARLADFGLARPIDDTSAIVAGTLAYMAPEQHDGAAVSEAADQFAFAAALWEAVFSTRPFAGETAAALADAKRAGRFVEPPRGRAPGWLTAVLRRALAPSPADRFASLADLGRALERGLARRRRAIVASSAVAVAAATFAGGVLASPDDEVEHCTGSRDTLAISWNPTARSQVVAHLATLGPYATQESTRLTHALDDYGARWVVSHRTTCKANEHGEISPVVYERNLACLERARASLGAAVEVMTRVPEDRVSNAITAANSLPDPEGCRAAATDSRVALPAASLTPVVNSLANQVERIRVRAFAGEPDAADEAAAVVRAAEQLGYPPLVARGKLVHGLAWFVRREMPQAFPLLEEAANLALLADEDALFVEAYAREVFAVAAGDRAELPAKASEVFGAISFAVQIAKRLGPAAAFERPLLYNNIGVYYWVGVNDRAKARQWFFLATEEPLTRAGHPELSVVYQNLAFMTDAAPERARLLAQRIATLEQMLGVDHVQTLTARFAAGLALGDGHAATDALRAVCDRLRMLHPQSGRETIEECSYELAYLALERGDATEARRHFAELQSDENDLAVAHMYFDLADGKLDRAIDIPARLRPRPDAEPWTLTHTADAMLIAARAEIQRGRKDAAIELLATTVATLEPVTDTGVVIERRLARVRTELAALLVARDPKAARAHAMAALAWYRTTGGYHATVRDLDAIVTAAAAGLH